MAIPLFFSSYSPSPFPFNFSCAKKNVPKKIIQVLTMIIYTEKEYVNIQKPIPYLFSYSNELKNQTNRLKSSKPKMIITITKGNCPPFSLTHDLLFVKKKTKKHKGGRNARDDGA